MNSINRLRNKSIDTDMHNVHSHLSHSHTVSLWFAEKLEKTDLALMLPDHSSLLLQQIYHNDYNIITC